MASRSKVTMKRLLSCLLIILLSSTLVCESASLIKRRTIPDYETDFEDEKTILPKADTNSRLLLKIYDAVLQDAIERGSTQQEVQSLMRKRSGLRKCFFHAVNCW